MTKDRKLHYQSRVLVESNPLFFSLSSTTLSFETRGGRTTPPLARPRYEKQRARARVKVGEEKRKEAVVTDCSARATNIPRNGWTTLFGRYHNFPASRAPALRTVVLLATQKSHELMHVDGFSHTIVENYLHLWPPCSIINVIGSYPTKLLFCLLPEHREQVT